MSEQDDIGTRGEVIAQLELMEPCRRMRGREEGIFAPVLLGAKHPTIDLVVQLKHVGSRLLFFVAQVKSTRDIPVNPSSRLPIKVSAHDVDRLLNSSVPAT